MNPASSPKPTNAAVPGCASCQETCPRQGKLRLAFRQHVWVCPGNSYSFHRMRIDVAPEESPPGKATDSTGAVHPLLRAEPCRAEVRDKHKRWSRSVVPGRLPSQMAEARRVIAPRCHSRVHVSADAECRKTGATPCEGSTPGLVPQRSVRQSRDLRGLARRQLQSAVARQTRAGLFARAQTSSDADVLKAPVPSHSGSSTPGTTASTSGRAGSTGRVQVAPRWRVLTDLGP